MLSSPRLGSYGSPPGPRHLVSIGSQISTLSLPVSVHSFNTDGLGVA